MAFTSTNPVVIGNKTKKSDYDTVLDNTTWLHTKILGLSGDADTTVAFTIQKGTGLFTDVTNGDIEYGGGTDTTDGGLMRCHGNTHATYPGEVHIFAIGSNANIVLDCDTGGEIALDADHVTAKTKAGVDRMVVTTSLTDVAIDFKTTGGASGGNVNIHCGEFVIASGSLIIPNGTASGSPASPSEGAIWYETDANKLWVYDNLSGWVGVALT